MTRQELWQQIANGERPRIATDYCHDQYDTLQKIVEWVSLMARPEYSAQFIGPAMMNKIKSIIEDEVLDVCLNLESEPGAFVDDSPAPLDDSPEDEAYRMRCATESLQAEADVADEILRDELSS